MGSSNPYEWDKINLRSDSRRIYIWRELGTRNNPSKIIERGHFGGAGVLFCSGIILYSRTSCKQVRSLVFAIVPRFSCITGVCLELLWSWTSSSWTATLTPHRTVVVAGLLRVKIFSTWIVRSSGLHTIEHVRGLLGRRLVVPHKALTRILQLQLAFKRNGARYLKSPLTTSFSASTDVVNPASRSWVTKIKK